MKGSALLTIIVLLISLCPLQAQDADYDVATFVVELLDYSLSAWNYSDYKMQKLGEGMFDKLLGATIMVEGDVLAKDVDFDETASQSVVQMYGAIGSRQWVTASRMRDNDIPNDFSNLVRSDQLEQQLSVMFDGGFDCTYMKSREDFGRTRAGGSGYYLVVQTVLRSDTDRLAMELEGVSHVQMFGRINNFQLTVDDRRNRLVLLLYIEEINTKIADAAQVAEETQTRYRFSDLRGKQAWLRADVLEGKISAIVGTKDQPYTNVLPGGVRYRGHINFTHKADYASIGEFVSDARGYSVWKGEQYIPSGQLVQIIECRERDNNILVTVKPVDGSAPDMDLYFIVERSNPMNIDPELQDQLIRHIFDIDESAL